MSLIGKILAIFAIAFVIFLLSGWLAQAVMLVTGCVWTSSASFGFTFLAIAGVVASVASNIWDLTHLF